MVKFIFKRLSSKTKQEDAEKRIKTRRISVGRRVDSYFTL